MDNGDIMSPRLWCGQEMKELAALAYRDTLPESRDFWKNEMAQAIREIEQMYAEKLDMMKTEMESSYDLKVILVPCPQLNVARS